MVNDTLLTNTLFHDLIYLIQNIFQIRKLHGSETNELSTFQTKKLELMIHFIQNIFPTEKFHSRVLLITLSGKCCLNNNKTNDQVKIDSRLVLWDHQRPSKFEIMHDHSDCRKCLFTNKNYKVYNNKKCATDDNIRILSNENHQSHLGQDKGNNYSILKHFEINSKIYHLSGFIIIMILIYLTKENIVAIAFIHNTVNDEDLSFSLSLILSYLMKKRKIEMFIKLIILLIIAIMIKSRSVQVHTKFETIIIEFI